jgi:hypothetical protein
MQHPEGEIGDEIGNLSAERTEWESTGLKSFHCTLLSSMSITPCVFLISVLIFL